MNKTVDEDKVKLDTSSYFTKDPSSLLTKTDMDVASLAESYLETIASETSPLVTTITPNEPSLSAAASFSQENEGDDGIEARIISLTFISYCIEG